MNVTVYNKRTPIFKLKLDENGSVCELGEMLNADLAPIIIKNQYSIKNVRRWMKRRRMPDNREGYGDVAALFGNLPKAKYRFSLSDQYWFAYSDTDNWDELNFFTNVYPTEYGRMFFSPWLIGDVRITEGPEMTTNGKLRKRWKQSDVDGEDLTSCLIKAGAEDRSQLPINEVLASITLSRIKLLPFVEYSLVVDGLEICSQCKNFITEDTEFVSAYDVFEIERWNRDEESEYNHFIRMCIKIGLDETWVKDYIDKMLTCHYLICNVDLHLTNFGFIRSAIDGKIISFAPLFDFGNAFFGDETKSNVAFPEIREAAIKKVLAAASIEPSVFDSIIDDAADIVDMCIDLTRKDKVEILDRMEKRFKQVKEMLGDPEKKKERQETDIGDESL